MLRIFKTMDDSQFVELEEFQSGCWVNLIAPTDEEIERVSCGLKLNVDFLRDALDDEESSRIESEDNQILIIVDIPVVEKDKDLDSVVFATVPLGIIINGNSIVTVCLYDNAVIEAFTRNKVKSFYTYKKTRFVLQLLFRASTLFLQYLKMIDKMSNRIERSLHHSMKNQALIRLLDLEKSLVYFSTSLKSNETVMEKLVKTEQLKMYPEDEDVLQDVLIENKQALEMASIYSNILRNMRDAFASVISNNINTVMKFMTTVTILIAIPTMIFSFFGMNVPLTLRSNPFGADIILGASVVCSLIASFFFWKRKMF